MDSHKIGSPEPGRPDERQNLAEPHEQAHLMHFRPYINSMIINLF